MFHGALKVIQYPQCAVHLMQRCWAQQPKDRPTATQILEIVESEDFVRLLDVLQLLSGMEITACCLISADLLQVIQGTKDSDDSDDGHSESSPFDQGETEGNMKKDSPVCNSNHFCSMSMDNSEVNISDIDINLDADEVWLCEHRIGRPSYTNLDIAEYFRGEDSKFDETHDTIYYDVVCSMFVIGNHVVMATSNNPKIRIYGIENRSLCKEIALPLHLTEDKGVRQMIYVDDYLFLALHQGSIISLPANDVLSPISDRELMSMARVCHGQEEDLFCVVAVEKEDTACPATGIEIWCGLASGHIAIADSSSMEYITGIDVKLDHMSISDFVVNTVALMAVTYSKGQQTVWASVQPGTFVYGFLAKTREQIAHINCLPHLTDLALVPVSATHKYVRQISDTQGTISALKAMGSQLYIGTSSGHILVKNEARNIQVLHAHCLGGVSSLLPFEVESNDLQWLPRFWRNQLTEVTDKLVSLTLSTSQVLSRRLLISFGHGCRHDALEQSEQSLLPNSRQRREAENSRYMMIWLVDDTC
jgi:hypothetical protein